MLSKFDRLRSGEVVEVEPGRTARLNLKDKTYETSEGRSIFVGNDPDFFPQGEEGLAYSRQKEGLETDIKKAPFGEFLYQFGNQGIAGSVKNAYNKITQSGDEYLRSKRVNQQVSQDISKRSPWTSAAATGASFIPDIAATSGMSALKAAPALAAMHAGPRIFEEPEQVAGEIATSAMGGYLIDKGANWLSKAAKRRGEVRALPGQQQAVREQNIAGQRAVDEANALQKHKFEVEKNDIKNVNRSFMDQHDADLLARENATIQNQNQFKAQNAARDAKIAELKQLDEIENQIFNMEKQNVKNVNKSKLEKHQNDLSERENRLIQDQNDYQSKVANRDAEVIRLKNQAEMEKTKNSANKARADADYKMAKDAADREDKLFADKFKAEQKQYEEELKRLPELQKQAQAEYSANVVKTAQEIEKNFPKDVRILPEELGLNQFIDQSIDKSGLAGSREGTQAKRILKSLFPENEFIRGRELASRYKALEDAIQRSKPEIQEVLNEFKQHLGNTLPTILEDSIAYNKIIPQILKSFETDLATILKVNKSNTRSSFLLDPGEYDRIFKSASRDVSSLLKNELNKTNIVQKLKEGQLGREIAEKSIHIEDFLQGNLIREVEIAHAQPKYLFLVDELAKKLDARIAKYEIKALESARTAGKKMGKEIKQTFGVAEPVAPPSAPMAPFPSAKPAPAVEFAELSAFQYPPPIEKPLIPSKLPPPNLMPEPSAPIPSASANIPPTINPPQALPMPAKPNLMGTPTPPMAQSFYPQAEPTMPLPQNFAESAGDFLEKPLLGGEGKGLNNPMLKLGGLKYLLGKSALPAEAAYLGMKGLTSPTAAGEMARMTFKQGGVQAIVSWAERYPSYQNGILQDPRDRRSLTKELEDAPDIPIEQKAIFQSKINRGKPLDQSL